MSAETLHTAVQSAGFAAVLSSTERLSFGVYTVKLFEATDKQIADCVWFLEHEAKYEIWNVDTFRGTTVITVAATKVADY